MTDTQSDPQALLEAIFGKKTGSGKPLSAEQKQRLEERIKKVLHTLSAREQEIIKLRYGLDGHSYTLEEVGRIFQQTREQIRQIEARAVRKLQHPGSSSEQP